MCRSRAELLTSTAVSSLPSKGRTTWCGSALLRLAPHARTDARTLSKMGVDIETLKPGDGVTFPKPGQVVTAHYTGAQRDASREKVKPAHGGMSAY